MRIISGTIRAAPFISCCGRVDGYECKHAGRHNDGLWRSPLAGMSLWLSLADFLAACLFIGIFSWSEQICPRLIKEFFKLRLPASSFIAQYGVVVDVDVQQLGRRCVASDHYVCASCQVNTSHSF